jgi:very-short-patch-repair endonuclease
MKVKCKFCGKEYSKNGIGTHIWRMHGEGKTHNPNKNRVAWNKGLKKETNESIKSQSEKIKGRESTFKGKHHSIESKEKISKARIKFLEENPDKVPYLINHSSNQSYPEELFEKELIKRNINGWVSRFRNGIYQYDFAWPDLKIDLEIDGATHNQPKVIKIDKRRDEFSKANGWIVIRFKAKRVKSNMNECINDLLEYLKLD